MNSIIKWTVWLSDNAGDFVRADKVQEKGGFVIFSKRDKEVARYKKSEIKEYKIAE